MSIDTWDKIGVFLGYVSGIPSASTSWPQMAAWIAEYGSRYTGVWAARIDSAGLWPTDIDVCYYQNAFLDDGPNLWPTPDSFATWLANDPSWITYIANTSQTQANNATPFPSSPNVALDFTNSAVLTNFISKYASQLNKAQTNVGTPTGYTSHGLPNSVSGGTIPQYSAIGMDNVSLNNAGAAKYNYTGGAFAQLGITGLWTGSAADRNFSTDFINYVGLYRAQLQALPRPLKLIINLNEGSIPLDDPLMVTLMGNIDGIWDEKGFTNYGGTPLSDLAFEQRVNFYQNMLGANGKIAWLQNTFGDETGTQQDRENGLACYLLIKTPLASVAMCPLISAGNPDYTHQYWYTTEYATNIGTPTQSAIMTQGIFSRKYTGGLVLFNHRSAQAYMYALPDGEQYQDNYGNYYSGYINLPAISGKVLIQL